IAPDIIPLISPTTSLQKLDTGPALRIKYIAILASLIRFDAIEWKGFSSALVIAIPIISNIIPIIIIMFKVKKANNRFKFLTKFSDRMLKIIAKMKVHIVIVNTHFILYLLKNLEPSFLSI